MGEINIGKIQLPNTPGPQVVERTPAEIKIGALTAEEQLEKERSLQASIAAIYKALPSIEEQLGNLTAGIEQLLGDVHSGELKRRSDQLDKI